MKSRDASKYEISVMSQADIHTAIDWARKEGWNPGLVDAFVFYAADNTGFLVGKLDDQPIATISAVKYGPSFGFVGLYIVDEEFRGQGYGLKIWEQAMASLRGRNVGLDGVLAQQDNYKKSGFRLAHRNIRFAGTSVKTKTVAANVHAVRNIEFQALEKFDRSFFPEERTAFLKEWVHPDNSNTLAIIDNSQIVAYGSIRACYRGFKIGPLNAENSDLASELFSALINSVPDGSEIFLDVPEPNEKAVQLAQQAGMSPVFETARMYTGDFPDLPLEKVFGITTFELG